jgi:hypothetical protein
MHSKLLLVALAATSILSAPVSAYAQRQWHPTPSSTQGDVGPQGNNNGTFTGWYGGPVGAYGPYGAYRQYGAYGPYAAYGAYGAFQPYGPYGRYRQRHPTPSSTQGDVGPQGNNNGTFTRW